MAPRLSLFHGPKEPPLSDVTLGQLIDQQAVKHAKQTQVISRWQDACFTFHEFSERSKTLARALLRSDVQYGDFVGIFAGNRYEYLELFYAAGRIGCPSVSFNTTYTESELVEAAKFTACKIVFISTHIGIRELSQHIDSLQKLPDLKHIVVIDGPRGSGHRQNIQTYDEFLRLGSSSRSIGNHVLAKAQACVKPSDVLNIQFTSGTTGLPKAALLTHYNLLNNSRFIFNALRCSANDIVLGLAPLFHCLGSAGGFLGALLTGACFVLPSDQFDPVAAVNAIAFTGVTCMQGVPTMYVAMIEVVRKHKIKLNTLRTGICAGSSVPPPLATQIKDVLGVKTISNALGMTELSPASFMPELSDDTQHRVFSVGKVLPHSTAKIIDPNTGELVPVGTPGELCVSGYNVFAGYLHNQEKTNEVVKTDYAGVRWMHTGDEVYFAEDGYAYITGRIKDIIIRGGENIYPGEIEARLVSHPGIVEASVLGVPDERYGEVVACFLRASGVSRNRLGDDEVRSWVGEKLSRQKIPQYVFWVGDEGVGEDYPKTGSGKHQKFELRKIAETILEQRRNHRIGERARL